MTLAIPAPGNQSEPPAQRHFQHNADDASECRCGRQAGKEHARKDHGVQHLRHRSVGKRNFL
jgi:hypothetical protein